MKYLVTGGLGFVGLNLTNRLLSEGHHVVVVDNASRHPDKFRYNPLFQSIKDWIGDRMELLFEDVSSNDCWARLNNYEDIDGVFHVAARLGNKASLEDPFRDEEVNIGGTVRMLEWAVDNSIDNIVVTSSICSWGRQKDGEKFTEEYGVPPSSPYGLSKLVCGEYAMLYRKMHGIQISVPKLFNVYGPGDLIGYDTNVIPLWIDTALRDGILTVTGPEGMRDYIFVDDVVDVLIETMENPTNCMFNLGTGVGTRTIDLANMIVDKIGSGTIEVTDPREWDKMNQRVADTSLLQSVVEKSDWTMIGDGLEKTIEWWERRYK